MIGIRATGLIMILIVVAGCAAESDEEAPRAESAREESSAAPAVAEDSAERDDESCPSFGELTESWDASGTPFVFDFRHPEGFETRKNEMVGDSMYQVDLIRQLRFAGASRQVAISIIQVLKPTEEPIPMEVKMMQQHGDNPAMQSMQEMAPKEAGEISFGGETIPIFRVTTDSKAVYKFNLPANGSYHPINVHVSATAIGSTCRDRLTELGDAWVRGLSPAD